MNFLTHAVVPGRFELGEDIGEVISCSPFCLLFLPWGRSKGMWPISVAEPRMAWKSFSFPRTCWNLGAGTSSSPGTFPTR